MNIKSQALAQQVKQKVYPVYLLTGQDHYLLNEAALTIKKAWRQLGDCDEKIISLNTPADWDLLLEAANSYSLFTDLVLIDARCDKKSIDAVGKKIMNRYLDNVNSKCVILLRAPNIPSKALQQLANHQHVVLVQAFPLPPAELLRWITTQLQQRGITYDPQIPSLIHQYTQGNMLACAQVIEKIDLIIEHNEYLTLEVAQEQLCDQCDYQLYDLTEACLARQPEKAVHILRQAQQNKTEPSLILWLLSQEIRQLIQLYNLCNQSIPFANACQQLKIWPQRVRGYDAMMKRLSLETLQSLLKTCHTLDLFIKSNQNQTIWHGLENIAVTLSASIR